ncbi:MULTISPECIES: hypothetical protein [Staphylococcus]|nr:MULTISPECIES: hypothetical protein [Staphylococcus]ECO2926550.1 hypothetical protein [Campylobacter jejuni]MBF9299396.1 hypothetical protein [Staphylococcus schleiferi]MBT2892181.1 hypothetical protein [Streptomyces sp. McG2]MBM5939395.1 hypothetical protein [Staphylococcus epidermidis]MBM5946131.1 hypothetical protein [Staphylococcus epidermidis]
MTRNFKILSTIMITIAILAGCGNHEDNNDSNKSKKEEVNQHSSKEEETNNNGKNDNDENEDVKKVEFSKYIKNGQHVFYEINTSSLGNHLMAESGSEKEGINLGEVGDETLNKDGTLKNIIATKDGKARAFNIDFNDNDTYTFENFSKYNGSELADKLDNAETKQLDDTKEKTNYDDPMQLLLINRNDIKGISFGFLNEENYNLEQEKESIKKGDFDYSIDYNTTFKPFEYKGKYYSGLAKVTSNKLDDELQVNKVLITEVKDKNEQITLDDKSQFDDNHIINYEDTNDGKAEQKEEDESVDNL